MSHGRRVLIVDDEALVRWSLGEAFREAGFLVTEASDARSGLEQIRSGDGVEVALLDCRLPDADGLTLCGALQQSWPGSLCLMMTAFRTPNLAHEAERLGARGVLDKPFDVEEVVALVRGYLDGPRE
ncbi:MAG TPA: response regulator [Vicinamibacterales bacterium]|nr:response regulator [Vicinamibacterales bacterium]